MILKLKNIYPDIIQISNIKTNLNINEKNINSYIINICIDINEIFFNKLVKKTT